MNLKVIAKAWLEVFKGTTTDEHKRKADICHTCTKAVYKPYIDFINDELKDVKGFVCGVCNCPLVAKIRSTDKCPKNKW